MFDEHMDNIHHSLCKPSELSIAMINERPLA